MATELINIYTDEQSEIIINNLFDVLQLGSQHYENMGETPRSEEFSVYKNKYYLEVNVFDENDSFLFTLNTGKPLLMTEGGEYYLGDYHLHQDVYMIGKRHTIAPHETLIKVRDSQIDIFPMVRQIGTSNFGAPKTQYCIKISQIFEIMRNLSTIDVQKNTKYKIQHAVMKDVLLGAAGLMGGKEGEFGG